ncbi:MAG: hypothetical protein IJ306_00545 [Oscillospiraceae bacterium]|nr:hypothetical protein [Oscillospiraceae bacterium]
MRFLLDIAPITPAEEFAMMLEEILPWMGLGIAALFVIAALWMAYLIKKNKK